MNYSDIPRPMREALGAFEMLRRFGFPSADIFWHQNESADPGGREPAGMMFVVLRTQGKDFTLRTGVVPTSYDEWCKSWQAVMQALLAGEIAQEERNRMLEESEAYQRWRDLARAIRAKGIRLPKPDVAVLSDALDGPPPN